MKKLLRKTTAALSAAIMTVCGCFGSFAAFAEKSEEPAEKEITVVYDFILDQDDIELGYRTDGNISSFDDFVPQTNKAGGIVNIPLGRFSSLQGDFKFEGWTVDDFYGYYCGDTFIIPKDYDEDVLTIRAVWSESDAASHMCKYNLEYNNEERERPTWLKDTKVHTNMVFEPNYARLMYDDVSSYGLMYGDVTLSYGTKIIIPDHDIELSPVWFKYINITYVAGDVDRLVGNTSFETTFNEGSSYELANAARFSRNGFNLTGWESSVDGKIYNVGETIIVPSEDVTYTAVWTPKTYKVVFKTGQGGSNIIVPGDTDTTITCPDPDHTVNGKYFAGWQDSEGNMYDVGDEYLIKGAISGGGIMLTGIWETGDPPTQETQPPTSENAEVTLIGDANCDGTVSIADSTAILQSLGNADKYGLTPEGEANADCYDPGSGVTGFDAIAIQKIDAKIISSLPEMPE